MKQILIIGASGGIGSALASVLGTKGNTVRALSRREDGFDLTDPARIDHLLIGLDTQFDQIVIATGALAINGAAPEKSISTLTAQAMMDQFAVNTIGPALVLKHAKKLLSRDRPSQICALSARVGSIGDNRLGGWYSYRASKAALNQVVRTASIELARTHPLAACVALHPGTVETEFTRKYLGRHPAVPALEAAENLIKVMDNLGPSQTGQFFDWAGKSVAW